MRKLIERLKEDCFLDPDRYVSLLLFFQLLCHSLFLLTFICLPLFSEVRTCCSAISRGKKNDRASKTPLPNARKRRKEQDPAWTAVCSLISASESACEAALPALVSLPQCASRQVSVLFPHTFSQELCDK